MERLELRHIKQDLILTYKAHFAKTTLSDNSLLIECFIETTAIINTVLYCTLAVFRCINTAKYVVILTADRSDKTVCG